MKESSYSKRGRFALIKKTLGNLLIYYMSLLTIPVSWLNNWKLFKVDSYGLIRKEEEDTIWLHET